MKEWINKIKIESKNDENNKLYIIIIQQQLLSNKLSDDVEADEN